MKLSNLQFFFLFIFCFPIQINAQQATIFEAFPKSDSKYIDDDLPGMNPELYLPNLFDYTKHHIHSAPVFSNDGKFMYFSAYINDEDPQKIFQVSLENGIWTKPKLVEFSGNYQDGGPKLSPDGRRLYFYSKRPESQIGSDVSESRVWFVDIENGKCSTPNLVNINNEHGLAFYPSGFKNDTCFQIWVKKGGGIYEDYDIGLSDGEINKIESSSDKFEIPDIEFYRQYSFPDCDFTFIDTYSAKEGSQLFICHKNENGEWGIPKSMGEMINEGQARFPGFTHDMKYFFFSSYRSGVERWYWIDAKYIDYLRDNE